MLLLSCGCGCLLLSMGWLRLGQVGAAAAGWDWCGCLPRLWLSAAAGCGRYCGGDWCGCSCCLLLLRMSLMLLWRRWLQGRLRLLWCALLLLLLRRRLVRLLHCC